MNKWNKSVDDNVAIGKGTFVFLAANMTDFVLAATNEPVAGDLLICICSWSLCPVVELWLLVEERVMISRFLISFVLISFDRWNNCRSPKWVQYLVCVGKFLELLLLSCFLLHVHQKKSEAPTTSRTCFLSCWASLDFACGYMVEERANNMKRSSTKMTQTVCNPSSQL